jgi:hypothetical protein
MGLTVDGNGFAIVAFLDRRWLILVQPKHKSTGTSSKGVDVLFNVTITRKCNRPSINVDMPWTPEDRGKVVIRHVWYGVCRTVTRSW